MNTAAVSVYSNVRLHAKTILITLLCGIHLRITSAAFVFCRTQRRDYCGIGYGAFTHRESFRSQMFIQIVKHLLLKSVLLKKITEIQQCSRIRYLLVIEIDA